MEREKIINQIKLILLDPYFPISERNKWEILIPKMSDEDLRELFENLKLKTEALFKVDTTLYKLGKTCEVNLNIDEEIDKEAKKYPLQDLSRENLILLFNKSLLPWLEKDFDFKSDIEAYLSFAADPDLREKLINALTTNEELIGEKNIAALTGKELKPTISNWLKDYEWRIADRSDLTLARAEYLTNSPNILKLSEKEKEKIKKIIELYDSLKRPIVLRPIVRETEAGNPPIDDFYFGRKTIDKISPFKDTTPPNHEIFKRELNEQKIATRKVDNPFEQKYLEESKDKNLENSK